MLDEEYGEPVSEHFAEFEEEAFAAASIGQVQARRCSTDAGRRSRSSIRRVEGVESDARNAGMLVRLARRWRQASTREVAEELRERVMEELDYEYEAQNQRSFSRAYRDHPFIYVPDVITRLRRRVLVTEYVEGTQFDEIKQSGDERSRFGEIVFRFCFGSIYHLQHFNADAHPPTS